MEHSIERLKNDLSAAFAVPRLFGNVVYGQQGRSGATIDMTPVDEEALMNFLMVARAHKRKVAEILFPDNAKGRVRALQNWINYGWNLITAMHIQQNGSDIPTETVHKYLAIALKIRNEYPETRPLSFSNVSAEHDFCQKALTTWLEAEKEFGTQQPERDLVRICSSCNQMCKDAWRHSSQDPTAKENPIVGIGCLALWLFSPANHLRRSPRVKPLEASDYLYKVLASPNNSEFAEIDKQLKGLRINGEFKVTRKGGRIYRIPKAQVNKLPLAEDADSGVNEPCLPGGEDEGYGIHEMSDIEDFQAEVCAWDAAWQKV